MALDTQATETLPSFKKEEAELKRAREEAACYSDLKDALLPPLVTPTLYGFTWAELEKLNGDFQAVKVGDTHRADYRIRLKEWSDRYGSIKEIGNIPAFFDIKHPDGSFERVYLRDHAIHKALKGLLGQEQLRRSTREVHLPPGFSKEDISQEFYVPLPGARAIDQEMMEEALGLIQDNYEKMLLGETSAAFKTYSAPALKVRRGKTSYLSKPLDLFDPYAYQKWAATTLAEKFLEAAPEQKKRRVMLDAPTRSGKTYMILWALKEVIQRQNGTYKGEESVFSDQGVARGEAATLTAIVTGFPDVFDEFQKTVEKHAHFRSFYSWITREELLLNPDIIKEKEAAGYKHIVLCLSLQDIAGRGQGGELKKIHQVVKGKVSYVIGDECHFAMFSEAPVYKAALADHLSSEEAREVDKSFALGKKATFLLDPKFGYLFASATTYSVLDKDIFDRSRDIVFASPYRIEREMKKIAEEYRDNPLDSPFFARPRKNYLGIDLGFPASELFRATNRGQFVHQAAVRAVLEAFWGLARYKNLPDIFASEVLKAAGAGRHILWQMPSKNSCDALEKMIRQIGLGEEYEILNISSKSKNAWTSMGICSLKDEIEKRQFGKTITITVARLLTGVSVPQWDSVVLATSGRSLTRTVQAYGRAETPWFVDIDDDDRGIKYCLKPNSFVFDLNPEELYGFLNQIDLHTHHLDSDEVTDEGVVPGGQAFFFDGLVMKKMTRQDVHRQLDEYLKQKKISALAASLDPAGELKIDDHLRGLIEINKKGGTRQVELNQLDEEILREEFSVSEIQEEKKAQEKTKDGGQEVNDPKQETEPLSLLREKEDRARREFIYKRFLLAAILTEEENPRKLLSYLWLDQERGQMARNLSLGQSMLQALGGALDDVFVADSIERAIKAILARMRSGDDQAMLYLQAVTELEALSDNQILTSLETVRQMVDSLNLDLEKIRRSLGGSRADFLDPAAKSGGLLLGLELEVTRIIEEALRRGEVTKAEAEHFRHLLSKSFVAIPTSAASYEIVRRLYHLLGWKEENILFSQAIPFALRDNWAYFVAQNSSLLLDIAALAKDEATRVMHKWLEDQGLLTTIKKKQAEEFLNFMLCLASKMSEKFDYIISNPPYQISGSEKNSKSFPIYPDFIDAARLIANTVIMIHPARFLSNAGETNKDWNLKTIESPEFSVLHFYPEASEIFPGPDIAGGVAITSFEKGKKDGGYKDIYIPDKMLAAIKDRVWQGREDEARLSEHISPRSPFRYPDKSLTGRRDIQPHAFQKAKSAFKTKGKRGDLQVLGLEKKERITRYTPRKTVADNPLIDAYKVFVPKAAGPGVFGVALSSPLVASPGMICTETFLTMGSFKTEAEAKALLLYIKSKFARALLGILKVTQDNPRATWAYIPWQDFSENSDIDWTVSPKELDRALYKKYALSKAEIAFIEKNVEEMK